MRFIKGFASIDALADNTSNTISIVGELSPYSYSYSRERGIFGSAILGDVEFVSFSARNDAGVISVTPSNIGSEIAETLNWIYTESLSASLGDDQPEIAETLTQFFSQFDEWNVGEIISADTFSIPSWVSWTSTNGGDPYYAKVWFTNAEFEGQYDEFEIVIVPPIDPVDGFFNNYVTVKSLLDSVTTADVIADINAAASQKPYSELKPTSINWLNNGNANTFLPTNWTAVVYGAYGLNITNIKAAIVEYILSHSTHTEAEWRILMPSLFISTEFIISPHWDRYSIPNQTVLAGMYNSTFTPQQIIDYALTTRGTYPELFVRGGVRGVTSTYKTLAFSIIGNPDNTDGISTFNAKFPDYTSIPSTSLDFARMTLTTQQWSTLLHNMLPVAESMSTLSSLPAGMTRVWRDNIMFLAASLDEVLYLVAAKYYFTHP